MSNRAQYIIDSVTPLNYIPTDDTAIVNGLFDPPAALPIQILAVLGNAMQLLHSPGSLSAARYSIAILMTLSLLARDFLMEYARAPCSQACQVAITYPVESFARASYLIFCVENRTLELARRVKYRSQSENLEGW
jgi:hypothetical protein